MSNVKLLSTLFAAATLASGSVDAAGYKCKVVKDGRGIIAEGKADCAGGGSDGKGSCAGTNKKGDVHAWIFVPDEAACSKINNGDFSGDLAKFKDKIEH